MKILYVSCRYNPSDRDAGSGVDFNLSEGFSRAGAEVKIIGPFPDRPAKIERIYRKFHRLFSKKLTAKFSENYLHTCARIMDKAVEENQPDAVFTHNLIPLVYSKSTVPVIYKTDSILFNMHPFWPTYSKFELYRMLNWEKRALDRSTLVVTASHHAEEALLDHYHLPASRILVVAIPSSLPEEVVPKKIDPKTIAKTDLHLLLVGRDYVRKGIDIAIETVKLLRSAGINANLRIVGLSGKNEEGVEFAGLYKKADPDQIKAYVSHYQWAHLLIHPARYEAAGIVCSEAAAFGVPTITNAAGGLATTVEDGVSGIVLQTGSKAENYAAAIIKLLDDPERFELLCKTARERYQTKLNWDFAVRSILAAFKKQA